MAAINLHYPKMKVFQLSSTQVASGALINTYEAGTSTAKATYSDQALTTANANPVVADSNGEAQVWLLDDGLYKIVITDSDSVAISTVDNVGSTVATASVDGVANLVPNGSFETNTGDNGTPTGWTLSITGTSTIQIDQADTFHGDSALEFVGGASGAGTATSGYFPVQSSKEVGIRFSLKASVATVNQTVTMLWYTDDAGTAASSASTAIYTVTTTAPTSWTEQVLTTTPGSDVLFAKIQIAGSADAGTTRYDDVVVDVGARAATQAEVDAGTNTYDFVTPITLAAFPNFTKDWDNFLTNFGTAADGAVTISANATYSNIIYDATTFVIDNTKVLTFDTGIGIIRATTSIVISGDIAMSGDDWLAFPFDFGASSVISNPSGAGGGGGGSYVNSGANNTAGSVGLAGHTSGWITDNGATVGTAGTAGAGNGGASSVGTAATAAQKDLISTLISNALVGGSNAGGAGGGAGDADEAVGGAGGAGGGGGGLLILISPSITIDATSTITMTGVAGSAGSNGTSVSNDVGGGGGGGGGGNGGVVIISTPSLTNGGTQTLTAGTGGAAGTASAGQAGDGGAGCAGIVGFVHSITTTV